MARLSVSCEALTYENPFETSLFLTFPNSQVYSQPPPHNPNAAALSAHGSCPCGLIKPPFGTKDVSRILGCWLWMPPSPNLMYIPKPHQVGEFI